MNRWIVWKKFESDWNHAWLDLTYLLTGFQITRDPFPCELGIRGLRKKLDEREKNEYEIILFKLEFFLHSGVNFDNGFPINFFDKLATKFSHILFLSTREIHVSLTESFEFHFWFGVTVHPRW